MRNIVIIDAHQIIRLYRIVNDDIVWFEQK